MKKIISLAGILTVLLQASAFAGKKDGQKQEQAVVPVPRLFQPKPDTAALTINMEPGFPELFAGSRYFQQHIRPYALTVRENLKAKPNALIMPNLRPHVLHARGYIEGLLAKYPQVQLLLDEIDLKLKYDAIDYQWLSFLGLRLQAAISNPERGVDIDVQETSTMFRENWQSESLKAQYEGEFNSGLERLDPKGSARKRFTPPIFAPFYGLNLTGIGVLIESFLQNIYPYGAADIAVNEADGSIWSQVMFAEHDWGHGDDYEVWVASVEKYFKFSDYYDYSKNSYSGEDYVVLEKRREFLKSIAWEGFNPIPVQKIVRDFACAKLVLIRDTYRDLFNMYLTHYANPRDVQVLSKALIGFFDVVHESNRSFSLQHTAGRNFFKIVAERLGEIIDGGEGRINSDVEFSEARKKYFSKEAAIDAVEADSNLGFEDTGYSSILNAKGKADLLKVAGIVIEEPVLTGDDEKDYPVVRAYRDKVENEMLNCVQFFRDTALSLIQEKDEKGLSLGDRFYKKALALEKDFDHKVSEEFRKQLGEKEKRAAAD